MAANISFAARLEMFLVAVTATAIEAGITSPAAEHLKGQHRATANPALWAMRDPWRGQVPGDCGMLCPWWASFSLPLIRIRSG